MKIYYLKDKIPQFEGSFKPPINSMGGCASHYSIKWDDVKKDDDGREYIAIVIIPESHNFGEGDWDSTYEFYQCCYCGKALYKGAFHKCVRQKPIGYYADGTPYWGI